MNNERTNYAVTMAVICFAITVLAIAMLTWIDSTYQPVTVIYYRDPIAVPTEVIPPTPIIVPMFFVSETPAPNVVYMIIPKPEVVYSTESSQNSVVESSDTYTPFQDVPLVPLVPLVPSPTVDGYLSWSPYAEPTLSPYQIDLNSLSLDDDIDRIYYGIKGTRTPIP
jgi:hypothetical protein